ncbi:enoyl-CoA hydratase-related protein [Actinocorallia sp. B10E7]|uniref:enoyl-CoA hydratase/isomerase family protein n=1 Tax=Actinocorallia sp. B10E7 TaxID=3153558 RepID=UPI00325D332B
MGSKVRYEAVDGTARITLSSPGDGNAINPELASDLLAAVRKAKADDVRVVVLSAEGKAFCVGGDIRSFSSADDVEVFLDDLAETLHHAVSELQRMDAIVVSAVAGVAAGAGVPLAAAADLVLAAQSAKFTLAYTGIGFSPDGGTSLLTASLGLHRALHMALLNPRLSAEQAREAGLVAEVHPDEELPAAVERVVSTLLAGSRTAQVATKRLLREQATPLAEGALRKETLSIRSCAASPDGREGVAAFLDKRAPQFPSGRSRSAE